MFGLGSQEHCPRTVQNRVDDDDDDDDGGGGGGGDGDGDGEGDDDDDDDDAYMATKRKHPRTLLIKYSQEPSRPYAKTPGNI